MACWSINDHWCDILKNAQRQMIYDKCGLSFAFNFFLLSECNYNGFCKWLFQK